MFKNNITHEYFELVNTKLVVGEYKKEETQAYTYMIRPGWVPHIELHQELETLVSDIIKKRPGWRFKASAPSHFRRWAYSTAGEPACAVDLTLWDGDEELGTVEYGPRNGYGDYGFNFDNHRLRRKRTRGQSSFSACPKTAAARIIKSFHSRTPKELIAETKNAVRDAVNTNANQTRWALDRVFDRIKDDVFTYLEQHWDEVHATLTPQTDSAAFPDFIDKYKAGRAVSRAYERKQGRIVHTQSSGRYLVSREDGDLETYTQDTLPQDLVLNLTLLKILSAGEVTSGVGMKVKDNMYFVMDRDEETVDG